MHKALNLGAHVHLVEELQVFEPAQPVESLVLARRKVSSATGRSGCHHVTWLSPHPFSLPSQKLLFAGSRFQLAQLPLADCSRYQSCTDCVLARDPYCAWSRNTSLCVRTDGLNGYGGVPREGRTPQCGTRSPLYLCRLLPQVPPGPGRAELQHTCLHPAAGGQAR